MILGGSGLCTSVVLPDLCIGTTRAIFRKFGNIPEEKDRLTSSLITGERRLDKYLIILIGYVDVWQVLFFKHVIIVFISVGLTGLRKKECGKSVFVSVVNGIVFKVCGDGLDVLILTPIVEKYSLKIFDISVGFSYVWLLKIIDSIEC